MNDKSSLLNQLKIDRDTPTPKGTRRLLWVAGGLAIVLIMATVGGILSCPSGIPVHAAVARAAGGSNASGAGSLLDASGYVVARRQATVSAKVTGKVREVMIEEGRRVEKDQIIARLDNSNAQAALNQARSQVRQAEANVVAAQAAYDNARPVHERNEKLVRTGAISNGAYDTSKATFDAARTGLDVAKSSLDVARAGLEIAQRNLDDTDIRAPFTGIVTVKNAQPGEMVSPISAGGGFTRTGIGTIVDMDSLEVEVDVSENFISRVHPQQQAVIKLNAYPDWQIPGELIAVIPTADRAKATVRVRVGFKEKDNRVVPDMGARVSFLNDAPAPSSAPPKTPGVIVPTEAIQSENGVNGVAFVVKDEHVQRRTLSLGARNQDGQTVLSGLAPGDRVVVGDMSQLSDGARVKIEP